ncbi:MAG TPA: hypothetical protein VF593_10865 [Chthoniobacteraceae bacterium]
MTPIPQTSVVQCADRLRALYWHRAVPRTLWVFLIFVGFLTTGLRMGHPWLGAVGVLFVASAFVIPHILRIRRFLAGLECPNCQQPAGTYFFRQAHLWLRCKHCGQESSTDCMITYAGGPPSKVDRGTG